MSARLSIGDCLAMAAQRFCNKLKWNPKSMRMRNVQDPNENPNKEHRKGWDLPLA